MKNFKNLIKEAHLGNPLNENKYLSNKDSYIKISEPSFRKDKNNPNFLSGYIKYDTGPGVGIALGKETMAGQIRRLSSQEAVRQMEIIARKLNDSFDIEDIEVTDLENGVVELFAVSDDFIDMDPRSELSMAMLGENQKYDDEDIVIYDGEEHIIMSRDGNMIYIRPLEDSAILGKKDEIKVHARALAYKSDLDKMYDKYKPKDEVNEENEKFDHIARAEYGKSFAMLSDEEKEEMLKAIAKYSKPAFKTDFQQRRQGDYSDDRDDGMTDYQRGRMDENMGEWPKELTSRYSDEYRFELEKVSPTYQDKPGRAKYRVIDIESGELKGTPVFGKPESLMAYADDLIKPQGGTQSTNLGESLDEDINDPALVRARAAKIADEKEKSKQAELDKKYGSNFMDKLDAEISLKQELQDLKAEYDDIINFQQENDPEVKPEGGEKADEYGGKLNDIDARMAEIKSELDDLRMYESVDEGTCGYGEDGVIGDKPASPDMEEAIDLGIDNAHSGDAALNRAVGEMGYNESLNKSLKEALNKRLGK